MNTFMSIMVNFINQIKINNFCHQVCYRLAASGLFRFNYTYTNKIQQLQQAKKRERNLANRHTALITRNWISERTIITNGLISSNLTGIRLYYNKHFLFLSLYIGFLAQHLGQFFPNSICYINRTLPLHQKWVLYQ